MAELEQQLLNALQAVEQPSGEKPCGCKGAAGADLLDPFGSEAGAGDLESQLDSALSGLQADAESSFSSLEGLSVEEELAFAEMSDTAGLSLEDVLSMAEKYPGLKITFSY